jgi:RNA polymerase sigma-70 factor (ECF subfamily)
MEADHETFAVRSAQNGVEKAWRYLFECHFEPVYRYCLSLSSGRQDIAEEITQQVFITAARRIGRFRQQKGSFRAWLFGIAKNDYMKTQSRELRHKCHEKQFLKNASERKNADAPKLFVYEALARLPVHYRSVLEAKYLEGLTVNEIAEANGSTPKAVESLLGRARDKFAQIYNQIRD